jgi:hypothetical protein
MPTVRLHTTARGNVHTTGVAFSLSSAAAAALAGISILRGGSLSQPFCSKPAKPLQPSSCVVLIACGALLLPSVHPGRSEPQAVLPEARGGILWKRRKSGVAHSLRDVGRWFLVTASPISSHVSRSWPRRCDLFGTQGEIGSANPRVLDRLALSHDVGELTQTVRRDGLGNGPKESCTQATDRFSRDG